MISIISHDSSEGEQWGRYNLPRLVDTNEHIIYVIQCEAPVR